ncbi:MAG: hypothetical protein H6Q17_562 [Bacteroidetes bacterium]|nr:hypothetical protein [Bacteroidota bacterium]
MDLKIKENNNGGDLYFENGDVLITSEVYNQPYLAHFGGNKEAVTADYVEGEEREDYWANELFLPEKERFDSYFEKMLHETELSSSGRIKLEQAATDDLEYLDDFAERESSVTIPTVDSVKLSDSFQEGQNRAFQYVWQEAKDEILVE